MKRIEWVDLAKYFCAMAIIIEHVSSAPAELTVLFATWMLEGFFFLAGYVHKSGQSFRTFMLKKVRCLLVPWLVFSVLDITLSHIVSFREHGSFLNELLWNFAQIRGVKAQLWFLPALFMTFIPFYFFVEQYEKHTGKDGKKRTVLFLLIALGLFGLMVVYNHVMAPHPFSWGSTALPWYLDYVFMAMLPMVLGYFMRHTCEAVFDKLNTRTNRLIALALFLCAVYYPYLTDLRLPDWAQEIQYRFINPYLGITVLIAFCKVMKPNRYMIYLGRNTLLCFAFHGKLLAFAEGVLKRIIPEVYTLLASSTPLSFVYSVALALAVSLVVIIPIYIVNRYFPFLIGKPRR
ncbi:MAG: acyltransferase [Eubacteriales bacterium]|nr:acyltransferase [Eubacteriales bacterium]